MKCINPTYDLLRVDERYSGTGLYAVVPPPVLVHRIAGFCPPGYRSEDKKPKVKDNQGSLKVVFTLQAIRWKCGKTSAKYN